MKKQLQRLLRHEERERTSNLRIMENHLYECLYDIISSDASETDKFPALQRYKTKIVRLHTERNARILLDATVHDRMEDEEPSLYNALKMLRRRETRTIQQVQDSQGHNITKTKEVRNAFVTHLRQKYNPIHVDSDSLLMMQEFIQLVGTTNDAAVLEQPISTEEIHHALRSGAGHKSPRIDGICLEFYTANWDTIQTDLTELINQMFIHKTIHPRQKHGILMSA